MLLNYVDGCDVCYNVTKYSYMYVFFIEDMLYMYMYIMYVYIILMSTCVCVCVCHYILYEDAQSTIWYM